MFRLNYDEAEQRAVRETIASGWISTGPKCAQLEAEFCAALGSSHALGLANCTVALHLAMRLLDIGPGDEVICPSLTFVATANAIRYVGATPVFADICSLDQPTIDPQSIRERISSRTRAIMVMHYAGFPCRMDEIGALARQHGLKLIEDACHGPLSEFDGRKLGTLGDIGCFSFFSNKNISTGEGGMLVTDDGELAERARLLRSHGMTTMSYQRAMGHASAYDVVELGYNYRLDDLRASLALVQLAKLPADLEKRAVVRRWYEERLLNTDRLVLPFGGHTGFVSNYVMPVLLDDGGAERRDAVRAALERDGIQTSIHYPPVHRFSIYKPFASEMPNTELFADRAITLPMYASLSEDEVDHVCMSLLQSLDQI